MLKKILEKILVGIWVLLFGVVTVGILVIMPVFSIYLFIQSPLSTNGIWLIWGLFVLTMNITMAIQYFADKRRGESWEETNNYSVQIGIWKYCSWFPVWKELRAKSEQEAVDKVKALGFAPGRVVKLLL